MAISLEPRGTLRSLAPCMQAVSARGRTSSALRFPSACAPGATPAPRSARWLGVAAALLAGVLAACDPYVQGNGVYREEQRPEIGGFTGVHVEGGIEATVTSGAPSQSVTVSGDANVVQYIETEVRMESGRNVLHVWPSRVISGTIPPRAVIEVPLLDHARATDSARINGRRISAPSFEAVAEHGGNVVLEGTAAPAGASLEVRLATGALLNATAYAVSGGATVQLSGSSIARLRSEGPVTGTVTGGSQLDNSLGAGTCAAVIADPTSRLTCH